jgi:hypothetical protein
MNNALLMQLLAARGGGAPCGDLLTQLQNAGPGRPGFQIQDLIDRVSQTNPTAALLIQQLGMGQAAQNRVIEGEVVEITEPDADPALLEPIDSSAEGCTLEATIREQSERIDALHAEIAHLREHLDRCAGALGACGTCWGADPRCRACRGRGFPGYASPDEQLYAELVAPAVRTMKAYRVVTSPKLGRSPLRHKVPTNHAPA